MASWLRRLKNRARDGRWAKRLVLHEYGHLLSRNLKRPVDALGEPVPWYCYPAIEFLSQFDFSACDLFEYGAGNSSLFWAKRCRSVTSVEDSPEWHRIVRASRMPNQEILLETDRARYVAAVGEGPGSFDIIVIDGKYRCSCARESVKHLKPGGFIILDNSDWMPKASAFLREYDLLQVDFKGPGPMVDYTTSTSLFLCRDARLVPLGGVQPSPGIGSIVQASDSDT